MLKSQKVLGLMLTAAAFSAFAFGEVSAQSGGADDAAEISRYELTDAGLAQYEQATHNLVALGDCDSDSDSEDDPNLDQTIASINAMEGGPAAVQAAGMTTREYAIFGMAVIDALMGSWALSQPGGELPPDVSMNNVDFVRTHQAALQALGSSRKSADCEGE